MSSEKFFGLEETDYNKLKEWFKKNVDYQLDSEGYYPIDPVSYDDRFSMDFVGRFFKSYCKTVNKYPDSDIEAAFFDFLDTEGYTFLTERELDFLDYVLGEMPKDIKAIYNSITENGEFSTFDVFHDMVGYEGPTINPGSFLPTLRLNLRIASYQESNLDHAAIKTSFPDYAEELERVARRPVTDLNDNGLVYLLRQQGYKQEDLLKCLYDPSIFDPKQAELMEDPFIKSVIYELHNQTYDMGSLTVLAELKGEQILPILDKLARGISIGNNNKITVNDDFSETPCLEFSEDTMLGIFNPWDGAGSVLEIALAKPFIVPISLIEDVQFEGVRSRTSVNYGYTVDDVYGLIGSCWSDGSVKITDAKPDLVKEDPQHIIDVYNDLVKRINLSDNL